MASTEEGTTKDNPVLVSLNKANRTRSNPQSFRLHVKTSLS